MLHAGRHQFAEQIQLQAIPGGGNFRAHLQRIASDIGQMMTFIQYQQQMLWFRQYGFTFHRRHYQRVIRHHDFRFLYFTSGDKEWTFAVIVTVAVQTTGFIGT
ncbi:Uncharacterised protein [Salmonella enterica subsp. enterica serovar Bovismorbificans]|uniref:Uncharacterized protein n=1 Tax=Salmonella enterica subsp. enterica serovar Bovismorbificans TaxID=58097 RepID=A0A655BN03_SALET|nr:Uncharacterised protein [Salmonella enterica subsp. enterica serovar Bovismorbificans]